MATPALPGTLPVCRSASLPHKSNKTDDKDHVANGPLSAMVCRCQHIAAVNQQKGICMRNRLLARFSLTLTLLFIGTVLAGAGLWVDRSDARTLRTFTDSASVTDSFRTTLLPAMMHPRRDHTALLLADGQVLLAGGGVDAELYDPAARAFGNIEQPREGHQAALLDNFSRVLVTGGRTGGKALATAELWYPSGCPVTDTTCHGDFMATGTMQQARYWHTSTPLANGDVLIAGGRDDAGALKSAELYEPGSALKGSFVATGQMNQARLLHTATRLDDGRVLLVGGGNQAPLASAELYDPDSGRFTTTGSLQQGRQRHTATLLESGQVLITGGWNGGTLASAELYDPAAGTFTALPTMNEARAAHTATRLADGRVLIAGGYNQQGELRTAELYDPAQQTFTPAGRLQQARESHTATLLESGQVLVVGGYNKAAGVLVTAELYQPATDTFALTASLQQKRRRHTASPTSGGILIIGGTDGERELASAEFYDLAEQRFVRTNSLGNMTHARLAHSGTLLQNGQPLLAGGVLFYDPTDIDWRTYLVTSERYDPATEQFTASGEMVLAQPDHLASLLENGQVLITGGWNYYYGGSIDYAQLYKPASGTFVATGRMQHSRNDHTSTRLANGKVLVAGGACDCFGDFCRPCGGDQTLAAAETYDPATGLFTSIAPMNVARSDHTATLLPDGTVLLAGGYDNEALLSAERYDAATRSFAPTGQMNQARMRHTATRLPDGQVLLIGGSTGGSNVLDLVELYNPRTGQFRPVGLLLVARAEHTTTLLRNGDLLVAGGDAEDRLDSAELVQFTAGNLFTGTLTLPDSLVGTTVGDVAVSGATQGAALAAASLSNDGTTWGEWVALSEGETVTIPWNYGLPGRGKPVYLRLRDSNGRTATTVVGTLDVIAESTATPTATSRTEATPTPTATGSAAPTATRIATWSGALHLPFVIYGFPPTPTPTATSTPRPPTATNTPPPPTSTARPPTLTPTSRPNCHYSYPTVCIPPPPPDLDCSDIPYRRFRVLPPDPHNFDGDKDGIGCES